MSVEVRVAVDARPDEVWARWSAFDSWADWNTVCVSAGCDGPLEHGARLRLQLRHPRGRTFFTAPRLTAIRPGELLAWTTKALGFRAPTETTFDPDGDGGTLVTLRSESRGLLGFTYRMTFPEKTQGLLWSGALTALAQSFRDGPETG